MYQLIFTVCSIIQGASCHTLNPIPLETGAMGCAMAGQFEGAKYITAHPNYWIHGYKCKPVSDRYTYTNL